MNFRDTQTSQLTIAIDSSVKHIYKNEIYWILRLLLSTLGYTWHEVDDHCDQYDIYYGTDQNKVHHCKLYIALDPEKWHNRHQLQFIDLQTYAQCSVPEYSTTSRQQLKVPHESHGTITIHRDILFDMYYLICGLDEAHHKQNKHGFYNLKNTVYDKNNIFSHALASEIGLYFKSVLKRQFDHHTLPMWPNNNKAAIAFTHDVDYPVPIKWIEPIRVLYRRGISAAKPAWSLLKGQHHHWHFLSWRSLEQRYGITSSFFFAARQGNLWQYATGLPDPFYDVCSPAFVELFKQLNESNTEIGLHASYLAHTNSQQFELERHKLAHVANAPIDGTRHHYFQLDHKSPEKTLYLHDKVGFLYDSSLAHELYSGWRRHCSWPYFPFYKDRQCQVRTLQLPLSLMDQQLFSYQTLTQQQRIAQCIQLIDTVISQRGVFVINMHEYFYDEFIYPGYRDFYRKICEYVVGKGDCWISTPTQLAKHWVTRYQHIVDCSKGLIDDRLPP